MHNQNWHYYNSPKHDESENNSCLSQDIAQIPRYLEMFVKPLDPLSPNKLREESLMDISPLKQDYSSNFDITRLEIISHSPLFTPEKKNAINRNLHGNILQTPNSVFNLENEISPFQAKLPRRIDFSTRSPISKRNEIFKQQSDKYDPSTYTIHGNHILDHYNNLRDKGFINEAEKHLSNVYFVEHVNSNNKGDDYEYRYVSSDNYVLCNNFTEDNRFYDANTDSRYMVNISNPAFTSEHTVTLSTNDNVNREIYQQISNNEKLSKNNTKNKINNLALNQNFNGKSTNMGTESEKSYLQRSKELNSIIYPESKGCSAQNNVTFEKDSEIDSENREYQGCQKCNCKNSKCIKLYCECFRAGLYCNSCNCLNCRNLPQYEEERKKAIAHISARNPSAFKPKFVIVDEKQNDLNNSSVNILNSRCSSPNEKENEFKNQDQIIAENVQHYKGCNCKKSGCTKKYCECYQMKIPCTEICKCVGCKNCAPSKSDSLSKDMNDIESSISMVLDTKGYLRKRGESFYNNKGFNQIQINYDMHSEKKFNLGENSQILKGDSKRNISANQINLDFNKSESSKKINPSLKASMLNEVFLTNTKSKCKQLYDSEKLNLIQGNTKKIR